MADGQEISYPYIEYRTSFEAGTSFHGNIISRKSIKELNSALRIQDIPSEKTLPESLKDEKVQCEWCLNYVKKNEGEITKIPFYIYDWKVYDEKITSDTLVNWHIGARNAQESETVYNYINTLLETTSNNGGDNSEGNNESSETEQPIEE